MIQGVVFDWGGVVIEHNAKEVLKYCAGSLGVDTQYAHTTAFDPPIVSVSVFSS